MRRDSVQYQANTCDCTCSILPDSTATYGPTKPSPYHLFPPSSLADRHNPSRSKNHGEKISLANYKKSRDVSRGKDDRSKSKSVKKPENSYNIPVKTGPRVVEEPGRSRDIRHEYYTRVTPVLKQPQVRNNFQRVQYGTVEFKRQYSYSKPINNYIRPVQPYYTISEHQTKTGPIAGQRYLLPSSSQKITPITTLQKQSVTIPQSSKLTSYLTVPNKRPPDLSTQASNYIIAHKSQEPSRIEVSEQNTIRDKQPSISEIEDDSIQKPKPLTYFKAIESINDMTEQSLDERSEVLSYGFHRDSNPHLSWGGRQGTDALLERLKRKFAHPKSSIMGSNAYISHRF